jgi:formylglycine-generating enzyme required for sulfatase activity
VYYLDNSHPATVSPFTLDLYEVTVSRFRQFVISYQAPAPHTGANPNDMTDPGWDPSWNAKLAPDSTTLQGRLACQGGGTWTAETGQNELLPITCVDWYTAFAFCVWDGGRLPTEAEWNFAAAGGGDEQRVYPWSMPPTDTTISLQDATYTPSTASTITSLSDVGFASAGAGKWGHLDLAGNVAEWVRDTYSNAYGSTTTCHDCSDFSSGSKVIRGGAFDFTEFDVTSSERVPMLPDSSANDVGFRCARAAP